MGKLRKLLGLDRRREPVNCCEECRRAASQVRNEKLSTALPKPTNQ